MKRREFIAGLGGAVAWPVVARAQQREVRRVGFLTYGREAETSGTSMSRRLSDELEKLGWTG